MDPKLMLALAFIVTSVVMFVVAVPRKGEVVGFLRNRDWLQMGYAMIFVGRLVTGIAVGADCLW